MSGHRLPRLPPRLSLRATEVHVVRICLDQQTDGGVELLDADECERANRFIFDRDRRRFINAHVGLRTVVGRCLDRPAASLCFAADEAGKPRLRWPPSDLRFNLSHAGERALVAVSLGRELGVDIEQEQPIEVLRLASHFFAPREVGALHRLPPDQQTSAFFRGWTRKEAFVKALGTGLLLPLDTFEVNLTDTHASQLLCACRLEPSAMHRWRIVSLATDAGYAAALASDAADWHIVQWALVV